MCISCFNDTKPLQVGLNSRYDPGRPNRCTLKGSRGEVGVCSKWAHTPACCEAMCWRHYQEAHPDEVLHMSLSEFRILIQYLEGD